MVSENIPIEIVININPQKYLKIHVNSYPDTAKISCLKTNQIPNILKNQPKTKSLMNIPPEMSFKKIWKSMVKS